MIEPIKTKRGYKFGATPYPLRIKNPDGTVFGWRHAGQDYPATKGTLVVAPQPGKVILAGSNGSAGVEVRIQSGTTISRLLHNSSVLVKVGQTVREGQSVARSGNTGFTTGPHLHWSVSKNGKYINPLSQLVAPKPKYNMPKIGSTVQLVPTDKRTTFRAGTTKVAGTINVKNNSYFYLVRGYDKKYPNRILINSASAGGKGVALALYFVSGKRIPKWKTIK